MKRLLLLALLAACGSHPGNGADAGAGDGGDDSDASQPPADAAPIDVPNVKGTVNVHVANSTSATALCMPGLHVVFIDTDGTKLPVTADASGNASADVFPGASVTVICHRTSGSYTLVTIQAVEPGDDLVLNADAFLTGIQKADTTAAGTFTVSYAADAGAAGYTIYSPCGATGATGTSKQLTMSAGCVTPTMDIVVVANNSGGNPIAWTEAPAVAFTSGGTATVTDTWHALGSVTTTYTNPTAKMANLEIDRFAPDLRGLRATASMNTNGGTVMLSASTPLTTKATIQTIISPCAIGDPNCSEPGSEILTRVVDGSAATQTVDLTASTLPWVGAPTYVPATTTLTVPVTGTGAIDIFEADLTYVRSNTTIYVWRVFGPAIGNVVFPALPGGESPMPCSAQMCTDVQSSSHVRIGESDAITGYRAARQNVFDSLETCEQSSSPTAKHLPGTVNRFMRSN